MLTTSEYIQMAGRAGRRGKDDKGIVIYLPNKDPEEPLLVKQMFTGNTISISSQMDFSYDYILSSMFYGKDFQDQTYWMIQRKEYNKKFEEEIEVKKQQCPKFEDFILHDLEVRDELETKIQENVNAKKKNFQAQLEHWKNKHSSGTWDQLWKQYKNSKKIREEIKNLEIDLKESSTYDWEIGYRRSLLIEFGYIEDDKLTTKGILASQIHEGHPLIMSEMFANKVIKNTE
jgi:superfamily II RNA helicase